MIPLFLLMFGGVVLALVLHEKRLEDEAWQKLGEFLGLRFRSGRHLEGRIEGHDVEIDSVSRGSGKTQHTCFRVVVKAPPAAQLLSIRSEGSWTHLKKWLGSDDLRVGHDHFDDRLHLKGDPLQAVALLDADLRANLHGFVHGLGGVVEDGELRWETPVITSKIHSVIGAVEAATKLATALDVDLSQPAERLAQNAIGDPEPGVRLRNFELLEKHFPERATVVAETLRLDPSDALRLAVATHLADDFAFEHHSARLQTAEDLAVCSSTLKLLLERFPYERVASQFEELLSTGRREVVLPTLRAIAEYGDLSRRVLVEQWAGFEDWELAAEVATTLGRLGDPASQDVLVSMLATPSDEVKTAAAWALGELASVRAVEALWPLSREFSLHGALKPAAQDAIRKIQARAGEAEGGRLSVVSLAAEEGALTFAGEVGGLSIAEETEASSPSPSKERG